MTAVNGRVLSEEELKEAEFVQLPIVHNLIATMKDALFTAIAPNITFTNCRHHSQTVEATEKEATTLKWYEFSQGKRFVCESCGQPFTAQGGWFVRPWSTRQSR